jgi:minor extracellular serine protease Vpr
MNYRKLLFGCFVVLLATQAVLAQVVKRETVQPLASPSSAKLPANSPRSPEPQTVVLKLSGSPVAVVRAGLPGKMIPDAQKLAIIQSLKTQQQALIPSIQAMGGKVLATYQQVLNGIKVQATPDEIQAMSKLPGVIEVKPVMTYHIDNALSVPFIGTPKVWNNPPGLHGEHIKVAIIDTGIDYTHANFGGPGTVAAFQAAQSTSTMPANPALFGPGAPRVKGGYDLVGDAYTGGNTPQPDPNPLDCNGHGSHTAGTAAGSGVTAAGSTFTGPYDLTTPGQSFIIGPGVAPEADIYSYRVFGCSGSTNVVVEALEMALADGVQVVSMSLGSNFGSALTADAEASQNLVNAGIVVAAASGNAGPIPYITSTPASGTKAISVAAMDSHTTFPGANLALTPSGSITVQNSNGYPFSNGTQWPVVVLRNPNGSISLGCNSNEYSTATGGTDVTGKLVVTMRGTCGRVDRAIYGEQGGAAAVAMINTSAGYPPYEGQITSNPDTGVPYTVTIPFFGVLQSDGNTLAGSTAATATNTTIANPTGGTIASFSSIGPLTGDGHMKPEIAAPGVSIFSTLVGSGNQGLYESGTSMATPHVAGVSALTTQAHPTWSASDVANAVVNTGDASQIVGYNATAAGNGLVQPYPAVLTKVSAHASDGTSALSFGRLQITTASYTGSQTLTLVNHSTGAASFSAAVVQGSGGTVAPHTATLGSNSVTVPANGTATLKLNLTVPQGSNSSSAFHNVEGRIVLTPTSGNNGVVLSVPYYAAVNARSLVTAKLNGSITGGTGSVAVANASGLFAGTARTFDWGIAAQHQSTFPTAIRSVGAQTISSGSGPAVRFAVNTLGQMSNPDSVEFDIYIFTSGNSNPDYEVVGADAGLLSGTGAFSGSMGVAVFDLVHGGGVLRFAATAPINGSTVLLPVLLSDLGISSSQAFSYVAFTTDLNTLSQDGEGTGWFNPFNNTISTGAAVSLAAGAGTTSVPITYNSSGAATSPTLGVMVVSLDNSTGNGTQALLLPIN